MLACMHACVYVCLLEHPIRIRDALNKYKNKVHLRRVSSEYQRAVEKLILPNFDWYLFDVPTISVDCVVAKIGRFEELQI